jgi:hypothetical protein
VQDNNSSNKRNTDFEAFRELWGLAGAANPNTRTIHLRVIMVLQSYMSRKDFAAFPSLPTIAGQIGRHVRTVQRALVDLASWGHLDIQRQWNAAKGCWKTNRYHPRIPRSVLNETLQKRYATIIAKLSPPPGGVELPLPGGVEMPPPSRRGDVTITSKGTSNLTSKGTSSCTGVAERDASQKENRKEALQWGSPRQRSAEPILTEWEAWAAETYGDEVRDTLLDFGPMAFGGGDIDGRALAAVVNAGIVRQRTDGSKVLFVPDEDAA